MYSFPIKNVILIFILIQINLAEYGPFRYVFLELLWYKTVSANYMPAIDAIFVTGTTTKNLGFYPFTVNSLTGETLNYGGMDVNTFTPEVKL